MSEPKASSLPRRFLEAVRFETLGIHPRLLAVRAVSALLPRRGAGEERATLLRNFGFRIGARTLVHGMPRLNGPGKLEERLIIGDDCIVDADVVLDLEERITLGACVTLSPGVMILTSTHELASREHRAGPVTRSPVKIGDGVWVGPRAIVLPGVTVGAGAVVGAGSVVNKDVPPHTRVGGSPAVVLETLSPDEPPVA